jgi:hypothetical protein
MVRIFWKDVNGFLDSASFQRYGIQLQQNIFCNQSYFSIVTHILFPESIMTLGTKDFSHHKQKPLEKFPINRAFTYIFDGIDDAAAQSRELISGKVVWAGCVCAIS